MSRIDQRAPPVGLRFRSNSLSPASSSIPCRFLPLATDHAAYGFPEDVKLLVARLHFHYANQARDIRCSSLLRSQTLEATSISPFWSKGHSPCPLASTVAKQIILYTMVFGPSSADTRQDWVHPAEARYSKHTRAITHCESGTKANSIVY